MFEKTKIIRSKKSKDVAKKAITEHGSDDEIKISAIKDHLSDLTKKIIRQEILDNKSRVDGRGLTDVRPINCELGLLPKAHGSALFTRGETQALVVLTLGTKDDAQIVDDAVNNRSKEVLFTL